MKTHLDDDTSFTSAKYPFIIKSGEFIITPLMHFANNKMQTLRNCIDCGVDLPRHNRAGKKKWLRCSHCNGKETVKIASKVSKKYFRTTKYLRKHHPILLMKILKRTERGQSKHKQVTKYLEKHHPKLLEKISNEQNNS